MTNQEIKALIKEFPRVFPNGGQPQVAFAPGRVNLLGEHTDYNDGFVLPMAIDVGIAMLAALNGSREVNLYSLDFQEQAHFSLDEIVTSEKQSWTNYFRGVCDELQKAGYNPQGFDLLVKGNVPQGAGLSSSAALEVATATLLDHLHAWKMDAVELIKLTQRAENEFVRVASGIMDQFASKLGKEDHALFLDCRSLEYELVSTPFEEQGYAIVVINSGVKRGLVNSEYNNRRKECQRAVEFLAKDLSSIVALRDVSVENLDLVNALPEPLNKRARHVITENNRVLLGVEALKSGDLETFGDCLKDSHQSLKDDFEVSCPELDLLVELALKQPGVLGSRMIGAGFGGCTVSLVPQANIRQFTLNVEKEYQNKTGIKPESFVFKASAGARIID